MISALATLTAAVLLGFILPGYLASILLGSRARFGSAFIISMLVLFYGVLGCDAAGLPITFPTVCVYEGVVTATLAWGVHRRIGWRAVRESIWPRSRKTEGGTAEKRVLLGCTVAAGVMMFLRYLVQPLSGADTPFRWDLLATQILGHGRMDFYPPLRPEDYRIYFFPDAIPPTVSIAYWWLYAAAGRHEPRLTVIAIVLQYACVIALTFRAATRLHSPRAGFLAAAILASSPLFYRALFIGQETGLTALSMAGMLFFLISSDGPRDVQSMVLAGLCGSLGALSREYGWMWIAIGAVVLAWQRQGWAAIAVFAATAAAVAAPWYVRTWVLTGDPFYPLAPGRLFRIATPVYSSFLEMRHELLGLGALSAENWGQLTRFLLLMAPLPLVLGPIVGACAPRRWGFLTLGALLLVAVWFQSVPYTEGGFLYSTRVLSAALVLLSPLTAFGLAAMSTRPRVGWLVTAAVVLCSAWMLVNALTFPVELDTIPLAGLPRIALHRQVFAYLETRLPGILGRVLPAGSRILGDDAYAHAALQGSPYELVPTWSPEVAFLFDPATEPREARRALLKRGIAAAFFGPQTAMSYFYSKYRYFAEDSRGWALLARSPETGYLLFALPDPGGAERP